MPFNAPFCQSEAFPAAQAMYRNFVCGPLDTLERSLRLWRLGFEVEGEKRGETGRTTWYVTSVRVFHKVCFIEFPGSWVTWIMFIILTCVCRSNYLVTSDAVVCSIDK